MDTETRSGEVFHAAFANFFVVNIKSKGDFVSLQAVFLVWEAHLISTNCPHKLEIFDRAEASLSRFVTLLLTKDTCHVYHFRIPDNRLWPVIKKGKKRMFK